MSRVGRGNRKPKGGGHSAQTLTAPCPQCGRRIELKRISVGVTITKRFCGCMLRPRHYKALEASAGQEG